MMKLEKKKVQRKKNKNERKKKATSCEVDKLKPKLFLVYTALYCGSNQKKLNLKIV